MRHNGPIGNKEDRKNATIVKMNINCQEGYVVYFRGIIDQNCDCNCNGVGKFYLS